MDNDYLENINYPNTFKEETVDHINISLLSNSHLGRVLDPGYAKTFTYPTLGQFRSVLSLWYWIKSTTLDDKLRKLIGHKLKEYVNKNNVSLNYLPNFKAVIGYATWLKLNMYSECLDELKETTLPFISYRVIKSNGLRVTSHYAEFIVPIIYFIKEAAISNTEPDFSLLISPKHTGKYTKENYYLGDRLTLGTTKTTSY